MNYEYSAELNTALKSFADLCRERIAPRAGDLDRVVPDAAAALLRENLRVLAEAGYLAQRFPTDYGGAARSAVDAAPFDEELGRACAATYWSAAASTTWCGCAIHLFGSPEQRARLLPALAKAELIGCFALTEPDGGSDLNQLATRADKRDGGWVLNGRKMFVTNGPLADVAVVLTKIRNGAADEGTGLFLVERGTPGFAAGAARATMGYRGSPTGDLTFTDCVLPVTALVGEVGSGLKQAQRVLAVGRIGLAAASVGLARACFDEAVKYAHQRKIAGQKIMKFQEVGFKIADMKMLIDTASLLVRRAAWLADTGADDADPVGRCAKVFATEAATKISSWAVQIHGGHGYLAEYLVERLYRDAKLGEIGEGTNEIQRGLIAQDCLARWT